MLSGVNRGFPSAETLAKGAGNLLGCAFGPYTSCLLVIVAQPNPSNPGEHGLRRKHPQLNSDTNDSSETFLTETRLKMRVFLWS